MSAAVVDEMAATSASARMTTTALMLITWERIDWTVARTPLGVRRLTQMAAALGVALLGTVLVSHLNTATDAESALGAYHLAFFVGTVMIALAALTGLLIRDEDAASTIRPRH